MSLPLRALRSKNKGRSLAKPLELFVNGVVLPGLDK